jgi:hypothetical protein
MGQWQQRTWDPTEPLAKNAPAVQSMPFVHDSGKMLLTLTVRGQEHSSIKLVLERIAELLESLP